jgi:hypothetical protein
MDGINELNARTCLQFQPRDGQVDYVRIIVSSPNAKFMHYLNSLASRGTTLDAGPGLAASVVCKN